VIDRRAVGVVDRYADVATVLDLDVLHGNVLEPRDRDAGRAVCGDQQVLDHLPVVRRRDRPGGSERALLQGVDRSGAVIRSGAHIPDRRVLGGRGPTVAPAPKGQRRYPTQAADDPHVHDGIRQLGIRGIDVS
jgi:hypothetical protein